MSTSGRRPTGRLAGHFTDDFGVTRQPFDGVGNRSTFEHGADANEQVGDVDGYHDRRVWDETRDEIQKIEVRRAISGKIGCKNREALAPD